VPEAEKEKCGAKREKREVGSRQFVVTVSWIKKSRKDLIFVARYEVLSGSTL
jgi:hypothetical protein